MKKIILLIICLSLISLFYPVFADDAPLDNSNWGVQPPPTRYDKGTNTAPTSEEVWDKQREQLIEGRYGSDESPSFLNRENMNPYDTDDGEGAAPDGQ